MLALEIELESRFEFVFEQSPTESAQPQENDDLKSGPKLTSKVIQKVIQK